MRVLVWTLACLLSHWRARPAQLGALLAGLAVATALWSGVQGVNAQARASYASAARLLGGADFATIARADGGRFGQEAFVALRRAGWPVSPVLEGEARVAGRTLRLVGVEPVTMPRGGALGAGEDAAGDLLTPPRAGLIAPETLRALGLGEGAAPLTEGGAALPRLVARPGLAPGTVVLDIGEAQRVLGAPGAVSRLIAPATMARDDAALAALAGPALRFSPRNPDGDLARLTDSFHLNLTAFGMLAFVVGLFIVHAAIGLAFEQRLPMLRTLRACGAPLRTLGAALLTEIALFAAVAGAAGMLGGYAIAAALLPDVAASLRGLYGAQIPGALTLAPSWWVSGMAMTLAGALAAAGSGLWKAWRAPLLAAAQPDAWLAAHRRMIAVQSMAAIALLAAAGLLAWLGSGLVAGFALLGALLLGAALALPGALDAALRLGARRARGPLAQWALADARQALPGLSLALMALMLALATNIGVGSMVDGFRLTFAGWLDQRLAAEIYVRARADDQARALEALAPTLPGVSALLPRRDLEFRIDGWPVGMEGLADDPTYTRNWPLLRAEPGAWEAVASGEGAMISEQLARRLGLGLGDTLTAPAPEGPWRLRVVGIHADYGNPKGQAVVSFDAMMAHWPDAARGGYALRASPEAVGPALAALRAEPALRGVEIVDQATLKAMSMGIFERTFAVTAALNALTLGVAGIALAASLTTLGAMRLTQLAPLWAMGVTRRRLALIETARMLALALATAALAVPLGVALAWALVAVVNVQAFGWRLPLHLFPGQWATMLGLALLTALAASAWPMLKLARTPPARLLGVFAHER